MPGPRVGVPKDFEAALVKKSLRNSIRTRAMNSREKNLLEEKLLNLERSTNRVHEVVRKEINSLMHELRVAEQYKTHEDPTQLTHTLDLREAQDNGEDNLTENSEITEVGESDLDIGDDTTASYYAHADTQSGSTKLGMNHTSSSLYSSKFLPNVSFSNLKKTRGLQTARSCQYGLTSGDCVHFPCILPETYTTLGYRLTGESVSPWTTTPRVFSPPRISYLGKSGDIDFSKKEKNVQNVFKDLRDKNKAKKPRDRAIRYGESISRHKLLNPVRPVPAEKIQLSLT